MESSRAGTCDLESMAHDLLEFPKEEKENQKKIQKKTLIRVCDFSGTQQPLMIDVSEHGAEQNYYCFYIIIVIVIIIIIF